ncbi:hypothetical protein CNEO2_80027 [Clostridium neonatale]|nr:hypothetical protein CNEO2_80027 [Clostridium neonatale]
MTLRQFHPYNNKIYINKTQSVTLHLSILTLIYKILFLLL